MTTHPVTNIDDVKPITFGNGERFEATFRWISRQNGAQELGYNVVTLAPGKVAFPYHCHHGIEEAFFIISGAGRLRYDGEEYPLRGGDFVACPPGKHSAHQIINDSEDDLQYLAISTTRMPDVVQYPDSGKVAMSCDADPEDGPDARPFRLIVREDAGVDYWEGEEGPDD